MYVAIQNSNRQWTKSLPEVAHVQTACTALRKVMCNQGSAAELGTYELCGKHRREGGLNMDKTNIENLIGLLLNIYTVKPKVKI
jgi:hypothetical protein